MVDLATGRFLRAVLLGAALFAALAGCDRISSNAGDLSVGECFDEPPQEEQEVEDVQRRPCNEAHTAEVVFVGDMAGATDAYPSDDQFLDAVSSQCVPAFNAYTGRDYDTDPELEIGYFIPTAEGWNVGDHELICYAIRVDAAPMTQSVKAP
jgi:hypothetical protein